MSLDLIIISGCTLIETYMQSWIEGTNMYQHTVGVCEDFKKSTSSSNLKISL